MNALRPPVIRRTRRISPIAALYELGLDESYPPQAKADLLAAIARNNNDLLHSFTTKPAVPPVSLPRR